MHSQEFRKHLELLIIKKCEEYVNTAGNLASLVECSRRQNEYRAIDFAFHLSTYRLSIEMFTLARLYNGLFDDEEHRELQRLAEEGIRRTEKDYLKVWGILFKSQKKKKIKL